MARDPLMPLTDVQWVLGHAHLTTTQLYLSQVSGIASAGREPAGQKLTGSLERRSARPDASPVTWEDPAVIPSHA
jgi:hypothetical protein